MTIRVILVPLAGEDRDRATLSAAFSIGERLKAHVEGVFVELDVFDALSTVGLTRSDAVDRISRETAGETERRRQMARSQFDTVSTNARATTAETPPAADRLSARWRAVVGAPHDLIGHEGRYADLVVFSCGEVATDSNIRRAFEQALLNTGRPLLLVPRSPPPTFGQRVGVAWDGSVAAARAVASALPLLRLAASVQMLTVQASPTRSDDLERLASYLAWHGIRGESCPIEPGDASVGEHVLQAATERGLDVLVMGGYGHNPRRDFSLGSVTYRVLSHPDLPFAVFMAH